LCLQRPYATVLAGLRSQRAAPAPSAHDTLGELLAARAGATPSGLAFADERRSATFGELHERADTLAGRFTRMGVRAGDRVAVVLPAGVGFAETFWALQLIGAVSCAFNPVALRQTLARRVSSIRPRLVVTDELELPAGRARVPAVAGDRGALAFLQRTSGSSGEPRAAMLTHGNVLAQLSATQEGEHIGADDVLVSWVPPWHDFGLVRFMIAPVWFGMPCHIVRPAIRTIPDWLATIGRVGATHTGAPDSAYRLACRLVDPASVDLSSLRYAANGGEAVRLSTIERFEERFGVPGTVAPGYGLAEATLGVTAHLPGERPAQDARGNVSCGTPFPGVELRVAGTPDAPAEILVRGDIVFGGYLDAPQETAAALRDGWLHTGDVGYLDGRGRLYVLGRQKAMIKRGGGVVAPREIEDAAHTVAGVGLAAAVGMGETPAGERVIVVVEAGDAGAEAAAMSAGVSAAIRDSLGFSPHDVLVVRPRTIPRTTNGKVRYGELRSMLPSLLAPEPG
jgi:acyl-CoA synthetase (AMP-forming)/AMP-acid ligase II